MEYQAYIRNITLEQWLKEEKGGNVEHTEKEAEKLVFYDEDDAESTLAYLNDNFSDCYTLLVEDDPAKLHYPEED